MLPLGKLDFVMELALTPERKLARVDAAVVRENLVSRGFHLQFPETQLDPLVAAVSAMAERARPAVTLGCLGAGIALALLPAWLASRWAPAGLLLAQPLLLLAWSGWRGRERGTPPCPGMSTCWGWRCSGGLPSH